MKELPTMRFSKPSPPLPTPPEEATVMGTFPVRPSMMGPGSEPPPPPVAPAYAPSSPPMPSSGEPTSSAWVRIWLRAQSREFTSLAVIGSSARHPEATLLAARSLARVSEELGQPVVVLDGRNLALSELVPMKGRLRALAQSGQRVVLALAMPQKNPLTVPLAQSVDAAVLCVFVGESKEIACAQAVEQVGRRLFVGSVVLRSS